MPLPALTLLGGCVVTTSCVATPFAVTLKAFVVALVRPFAVVCSVAPLPVLLIVKPVKTATPLTAVAVRVPPRTAPVS